MDEFLDQAWIWISKGLDAAATGLDVLIAPIETLGPAWTILVLALATVGITRILKPVFTSRRHAELESEFRHWKAIREEAMKAQDLEKGKALAKNIDQAQLNKAYYDYFFEGFMTHLFTTVLPILLTLAYLSRTYTKEGLMAKFGSPWIFSIGQDDPFRMGTLFWYILCILVSMTGYSLAARVLKKKDH
jgi:uncharacterized membrane protein (DUF106 family)